MALSIHEPPSSIHMWYGFYTDVYKACIEKHSAIGPSFVRRTLRLVGGCS